MSYRQRRATMVNDSDIDSWKTGFDQGGTGLGDHRARSGEDVASTRVKGSSSGPEIRYINPAIYTESVGEEEPKSDREQEGYRNGDAIDASHGDCNISAIDLPIAPKDATSVNRTNESRHPGRNTYRCYSTSFPDATLSLEPSTARSAVSSAASTTARVERRCKIGSILTDVDQNEAIKRDRHILDSRQVIRISTTSLSVGPSISDPQVSNGSDFGRRIAHSEWIRRKQAAAQRAREKEERAAKKLQAVEERAAREKEEKTRLEKENFLKWVERKRQQDLDRRATLKNELELQSQLKEMEDRLAGASTLYLRRWFHKKKEEQKAQHKEQETRQRKMDEERERRLEQSARAYEKWRENSKNKPKPATQGLLPHQKAKPAYVNPIPWQSIVEIDSDEAQESTFHEKKGNINQLKMSGKNTIAAHH